MKKSAEELPIGLGEANQEKERLQAILSELEVDEETITYKKQALLKEKMLAKMIIKQRKQSILELMQNLLKKTIEQATEEIDQLFYLLYLFLIFISKLKS
jgi:uncharacterized protein (DUF2344 family)